MTTAREAVELLRELLAAADQSVDASEGADDVAAMLRYGNAEKAAHAYLASLPSPEAPAEAVASIRWPSEIELTEAQLDACADIANTGTFVGYGARIAVAEVAMKRGIAIGRAGEKKA